jgi:hypothetical protein
MTNSVTIVLASQRGQPSAPQPGPSTPAVACSREDSVAQVSVHQVLPELVWTVALGPYQVERLSA